MAFITFSINKKNKTNTPYLNSIALLTFLFCIHILQFFILINKTELLFPSDKNDRISTFSHTALFIVIPVIILIRLLIKKSELEKMSMTSEEIKKGKIVLFTYIGLTFLFLIFLIWYKNGLI